MAAYLAVHELTGGGGGGGGGLVPACTWHFRLVVCCLDFHLVVVSCCYGVSCVYKDSPHDLASVHVLVAAAEQRSFMACDMCSWPH